MPIRRVKYDMQKKRIPISLIMCKTRLMLSQSFFRSLYAASVCVSVSENEPLDVICEWMLTRKNAHHILKWIYVSHYNPYNKLLGYEPILPFLILGFVLFFVSCSFSSSSSSNRTSTSSIFLYFEVVSSDVCICRVTTAAATAHNQ